MPIYPYGTLPSGASFSSTSSNIPAFERVSSIPSWLPTERTQELEDQYRNTNSAYDTSAYDAASRAQQSKILTTAMNAGNSAAAEYANRARQAGGSGLGAGFLKAQAATGARGLAADKELERQKFDASQREAAATHATAIATTLAGLRNDYLKTIVSYATSEDQTMGDYTAKMASLNMNDPNRRVTGGYNIDSIGRVSNAHGNLAYNTPGFNPSTGIIRYGGGG